MPVYRLDNVVQNYAWGSRTAIAELQGRPAPSGEPEAELWMGAHPKAPSKVVLEDETRSAIDVLADDPARTLGADVHSRFGGLPFLFKVLAAGAPLSIQTHPNSEQAQAGFQKEEAIGIDRLAPNRNYRDARHKPELICAMTPFSALMGFRERDQAKNLLLQLELQGVTTLVKALDEGYGVFLTTLLESKLDTSEIKARAVTLTSADPAFSWVDRLCEQYPGDPGVLAPLFLNLVVLQPSEGLFLRARILHSYLEGVGLELMANSDNVLRAGLTPKHVDPDELLKIAHFEPAAPKILRAEKTRAGVRSFPSEVDEFQLSVLDLADDPVDLAEIGVAIALCTEGRIELHDGESQIALSKGESALLTADAQARATGAGRVYVASLPWASSVPR